MTKKQTLFLTLWLLVGLAGSPTAWAVDGVIEINQASGIFIINAAGSYVLTGDLSRAPGGAGLMIQVDDVTLDLNGFSIIGSGGSFADGISITGSNVEEKKNIIGLNLMAFQNLVHFPLDPIVMAERGRIGRNSIAYSSSGYQTVERFCHMNVVVVIHGLGKEHVSMLARCVETDVFATSQEIGK